MNRFSKLAAASVAVSILAFAAPVMAANEGQIGGGDIYRIKNISKNVDFADPANADACNVLEYKVRIHNPGPGSLSKVNVKATLPSGVSNSNTSTLTASSVNADPSSTTDTATVNLSSAQSLSYVNGSAQLLDANGNLVKNLPDGITQGGVNIGDVNVSTNNRKYVQFEVKVSCPTPTPKPTPTPTPTPTPVTPTSAPAATPTALPNTGAGDVLGLFAGASATGAAVHTAVRRFRRR